MTDLAQVEQWLNSLPISQWQLAVGGAVAVVIVGLLLWVVPFRWIFISVVQLAILGGVGAGLYYGQRYFEETNLLAERRALDERAGALFNQTLQPGSPAACIDGSPAPAMLEACERTLFAEPQRVAAAVAIANERLVYLRDALRFAAERDPTYLTRVAGLRSAVEADPYGFVGHVLANQRNCAADACDEFTLLRDAARVKENMRVRRFEAFMIKHARAWQEPKDAPAKAAASPLAEEPTPKPGIAIAPAGVEPASPADFAPVPSNLAGPSTSTVEGPAPASAAAPPAAAASVTPPAALPAPAAPLPRPVAAEAAKAAAKAKAPAQAKAVEPPFRRSKEPVAGLPRVVPRDYLREKEEDAEPETTVQAPGAPTSIAPPRQNLLGN